MTYPTISSRQVADVLAERERQDAKWGEQNHPIETWMLILMEEVGEMSKAALENRPEDEVRSELVQVAAVALSMLESFDRQAAKRRARR